MNEQVILAFDVGGTFIKAGVVNQDGHVMVHTISEYEARANESEDELIKHFTAIIVDLIKKINSEHDVEIRGIGYAFPGPFDYDNGISYIRGLDKFEALYGINIGKQLTHSIQDDPLIRGILASNYTIAFENDASLFSLGEAISGQASQVDRAVCLTIGTGLGSGFVEKGRLVKHRHDVPENGWLYNLQYQSGIADDFVSRRGVLEIARQMDIDMTGGRDVRELAKAALGGDPLTCELFKRFGTQMADILASSLQSFQPDVVVLGGQISKSNELFVPAFVQKLQEYNLDIKVKISENTLYSSFRGIYHLLN